jgi:hypothetical protein
MIILIFAIAAGCILAERLWPAMALPRVRAWWPRVLLINAIQLGITILAGGEATPDAKNFTMTAEAGHKLYGIGENKYLAERASSTKYEVTVTINDDGTWSYEETTALRMAVMGDVFAHTDRNTMHRIG